MSTDAREAWQQRAADWVAFVLSAHVTALASGDRSELDEELNNLQKHLRTTPEGYALVPVPEWVPVGEQWPEDGTPVFWCFKDGRYVLDGTFFSRSADIYHEFFSHWMIRKHDKPAPPKSEPL